MANTRNDDMDRSGNKNTPQGSTAGNAQTGQMGNQGRDPVNQDRAMNRDNVMGQGSSGTEQGRQGQPGTTGDTGRRGPTDNTDE